MCNPDYVMLMAFNNDKKHQLLSSNLSLCHSNIMDFNKCHDLVKCHSINGIGKYHEYLGSSTKIIIIVFFFFFFYFSIDKTITDTMVHPFMFKVFFLHSSQISIFKKKENSYIIYIHI